MALSPFQTQLQGCIRAALKLVEVDLDIAYFVYDGALGNNAGLQSVTPTGLHLVHTVLDWADGKFQLLRRKLPSRKWLFDDIKALTSYLCFDSWDALMDFMLESFKKPIPPKPETG